MDRIGSTTIVSHHPAMRPAEQFQVAPLFSGKNKRAASGSKAVLPPQRTTTPVVETAPAVEPLAVALPVAAVDELILTRQPAALDEPHDLLPAPESPTSVHAHEDSPTVQASEEDGSVSDGELLSKPSTTEFLESQAEQRKRQHEQWGRRFAPLGQVMDYCTNAVKNQTRRATGAAAHAVTSLRDATTQAASTARKKAQRALANALKSASEAIDPGSDTSMHGSVHSSTEA